MSDDPQVPDYPTEAECLERGVPVERARYANGGPAMPTTGPHGTEGFSKLEAYAMAAMQAMFASKECMDELSKRTESPDDLLKVLAIGAFEVATAMLAEYERRMKEPAPTEPINEGR